MQIVISRASFSFSNIDASPGVPLRDSVRNIPSFVLQISDRRVLDLCFDTVLFTNFFLVGVSVNGEKERERKRRGEKS